MTRSVALLAPNLAVGGAERVVVELAHRLPRNRFDLHLVLLEARGELMNEVPPDVAVVDLGVTQGRQSPVQLMRALRKLRPDVVVSNLIQATLPLLAVSPLLPRRTRVVPVEHTLLSAVVRGQRHPRVWAAGCRLLYRRADKVIAVSDTVARDALTIIGSEVDITVIANPVRAPGPPGPSPFPPGHLHVLAVGRLVPEKGFDRLIEVFAEVVRLRPEARLVILGEGPQRSLLEADIDRRGLEGVVELAGYHPDAARWMGHADVLAATAHVEGLPLALLEALAAGTPVVAYDGPGGTRDLLEGVGGATLVRDGDEGGFVDALAAVLKGPPPPVTLPERFDPSRAIEDYVEVLDA